MTNADTHVLTAAPRPGLATLTHVIYALHALSAIAGLTGAASVVMAFRDGRLALPDRKPLPPARERSMMS